MAGRSLSSALLSLALLALIRLDSHVAQAACSHDLADRGLAHHLAKKEFLDLQALQKRQSPANLQQEEQLTSPQQQCTYYDYPPVSSVLSQYPPIWQIAQLVPGDTEAANAYNAIISDPQFPNLPPKGTPQGDFSTVQYDPTDPDCWWTWSRCDTPKHPGVPADVITCPEPSTFGLSYDDGPNCTDSTFYDFLEEKQQTATLYYIGSNVMDWPLQGQHGLANGHEIGIHTWSHRYSTALTNEQFFAELWYTRKAIKAVLGVTPTTWRPPFGDIDDRNRFIAHKLGLTAVLWTHDTFDWEVQNSGNPSGLPTASVVANYNAIYAGAAQGDFTQGGLIVLSHEINGATMDIAMSEYPAIRGTFKNVMPVTSCQNITQPYIEQSWTYPNFQQYAAGQNQSSNSTRPISSSSSSSSSSSPTSSASTNVTLASAKRATQTKTSATAQANLAQATQNATSPFTSGASAGISITGPAPILLMFIALLVIL